MSPSPAADALTEQVREYWNRRPCNLRHSPAPVGTRQYFDEVEARKYFVEPHILRFAEFARWNGRRVLEIGCGLGTDTINFARAGAQVTAVDLSGQSLALARQRAQLFGLADRITFVQADAQQLSQYVAPAPFDLVYSFGVIHHAPRPSEILEQVRRHFVMAGTTLKVMVYHRFAWKVFSIALREPGSAWSNLDRLVARHSEAQTGCPVTHIYSRAAARALVEDQGFHVTDLFVDHIFPYRVKEYVRYEYVKTVPLGWLPAPAMRWLEHRAGWHLCVTAKVL